LGRQYIANLLSLLTLKLQHTPQDFAGGPLLAIVNGNSGEVSFGERAQALQGDATGCSQA
jgi:hypothetical protein